MDSKKTENYRRPEHNSEYGEPGFVFTDYDRGARNENSDGDSGGNSEDEHEGSSEDN